MKENEYLPLLFKQLSGDITPAEASLLSVWISQSPENERIAQEYSLVWSTAGHYAKSFSVDMDADFAAIQARILQEEKPVLHARNVRFPYVRIAAALALLALAVWGYSTFGPSEYFDAQASALDVDKQQIQLSDGTQVWMRKGSSIQYAKSFEGKSTRRVQLTGEAYFEVAHDPQHPFRVELASGASVEVLGTQFDVRQSPDLTSVIVCSGKVKFSPNSRTQSPVLTANQMAVYDAKASTLRVSSTTTLNDLAWQTGNLEFIKTPLSQVLLDLEKFYHVKIELRNPALANCPHSALLSNQSLKNVLDGLAVTYQLKVTALSAGEYALSGGVCQ